MTIDWQTLYLACAICHLMVGLQTWEAKHGAPLGPLLLAPVWPLSILIWLWTWFWPVNVGSRKR